MLQLYAALLFAHSWVRWIVLATVVASTIRAVSGWRERRPFDRRDGQTLRVFVGAIDLQLAIGMLLYFAASPLAAITRASPGAALHDPLLRFFGVIHPLLAVATFIAAHATAVATRRAGDDRVALRRFAVGALVALGLLALLVPWPGLMHGRPLVRGPW